MCVCVCVCVRAHWSARNYTACSSFSASVLLSSCLVAHTHWNQHTPQALFSESAYVNMHAHARARYTQEGEQRERRKGRKGWVMERSEGWSV